MEHNSVPTVYIVNQDIASNSVTKRLLSSVDIFSRDFTSPSELLNNDSFSIPSCFLISYLLPEMTGFELMKRLRMEGVIQPCIFTSPKFEPELATQTLGEGGYGFIKKPFEPVAFLDLIQKALKHDKQSNYYLRLALSYENKISVLSKRENTVLKLLIDDRSAMEIGKALNISHRTVENHRTKIFTKLGISKRAELFRLASIFETIKNTGLLK